MIFTDLTLKKITVELNGIDDGGDQFIPFEYKGYLLLAYVRNVPERSKDNLFIAINRVDETEFIIGLDDSKMCGRRRSLPTNLEDAISYIDWITGIRGIPELKKEEK